MEISGKTREIPEKIRRSRGNAGEVRRECVIAEKERDRIERKMTGIARKGRQSMEDLLQFDEGRYTVESVERDGREITFRAFENIPYVTNPADKNMQRLSIYVPEAYYRGEKIGTYDLKTAPIFMPNTVGGYMPGPVERPGVNFMGKTNASFYAILRGCVVVSAGVRGREMTDEEGRFIGTAPAVICDMKAAVRYLRHNAACIPGDTDRIITNGTSAGGACSALMGATGDHPDYERYLEEMGAAREKDHIFAASCYCPITNLDHADMAYEWEFEGISEYHTMRMEAPAEKETETGKVPGSEERSKEEPAVRELKMTPVHGEMSAEQQRWSQELAKAFPAYVNSLGLRDETGRPIELDEAGRGSLADYIMEQVERSAKGQLSTGDFREFAKIRTRMKTTPAFDNVSMGTPENELFGSTQAKYRHFTQFSLKHSKVEESMAQEEQIRLMNPMYYIRDDKAVKAKHYRIRHGAADRDTSLSISALLTLLLREQGVDTDFAYPWGVIHSGDYDLEELFGWIDRICREA